MYIYFEFNIPVIPTIFHMNSSIMAKSIAQRYISQNINTKSSIGFKSTIEIIIISSVPFIVIRIYQRLTLDPITWTSSFILENDILRLIFSWIIHAQNGTVCSFRDSIVHFQNLFFSPPTSPSLFAAIVGVALPISPRCPMRLTSLLQGNRWVARGQTFTRLRRRQRGDR